MNTARDAMNKLQDQRETLELSKKKLIRDKGEVSSAIQVISKSADTSQLSELESRHKSIEKNLENVCNSLDVCITRLDYANADYRSIRKQLNDCKDKLDECKTRTQLFGDFLSSELHRVDRQPGWTFPDLFGTVMIVLGAAIGGVFGAVLLGVIAAIVLPKQQPQDNKIEKLKINLIKTKEEIRGVDAKINETQKILFVH